MKLKEYLIKNNLTELNFAEILGCKKIEDQTDGLVTYRDFIGAVYGKKSEN